MKKRLLFFVSITQIGGAETNVIKIAKELSLKGYEVHFATLEDNGPMFEQCEDFAASLNIIGLFYKTPLKSTVKFWKLLKEHKIDVVFNFGMRVEFFSRLVSKLYSDSIKVISNIRSTDTFRKKYHVLIDQLTFKYVDRWISNSIAGKHAFMEREQIPEGKIGVIYNYIEFPEIQQELIETNNKPGKLRIGILANIRQLKGYYDLVPLAHELTDAGLNPLFICGGIDHTNGDFAKLVQEEQLSSCFDFKGYVKDKRQFFDEIDLFILPSYMEGMPTVILESMYYGKPVISTNVGGMPEQIESGYNGYLYSPGDIDGFKGAIVNLHNNKQLARDFVSRSRTILKERFAKNASLDLWVSVIEQS
jgi:glycosyltransferase involved in cell wall biosynthesis